MRYTALVHVRKHTPERWTVALADPDARALVAHAASRAEAEEQLQEAVAARIEDPDDALGERLRHPLELETYRLDVTARVRKPSGRRREVPVPLLGARVLQGKGLARATLPRLGVWLTLTSAEDAAVQLADEARRELAAASDETIVALAPDLEEAIVPLEVFARPRERLRPRRAKRDERQGPLARIGHDLTAEGRRGRGAAAYERDAEVGAVLDALASSPPASVLLAGPSGVGKTAIVHEVARRIALGEAPAALAKARVYYLPGTRIIAGMQFFGDWEERCKELVDDAREHQAILFVDDLAELCEAGRSSEGDAGVARFLAPHVQRGEIALVAETTPERQRRVERIDASILALFRKVAVEELSRSRTLEVLRRAAGPLGRKHGVTFEPAALEAVLDLTRRFLPGRRLPGKAAGFLARAAELLGSGEGDGSKRSEALDAAWITAAFAQETGLPEIVLRDDVPLERDRLVAELEERVVEQPEAARALADAVLLVKTGLADPKKPAAVYLFVGPTGTGKTESARVLAERLFGDPARLLRFDMSEFQDPAGALRLFGTETAEGELPRRIRERPFAVLLLDEIEKAHESVFDGLLSVLGEGRLVDRGGRAADFRSAIVILTSNLGATDQAIGFHEDAGRSQRYTVAAEKFFRPELLNRIDRIVPFGMLSPAATERIARRELAQVVEREGLTRRGVTVTFTDELVASLARAGYHPRFGARPLKRELERRVLTPLADHLVRRAASPGAIEVYLDDAGEVRLGASGKRPTAAEELFDAEPPFTEPLAKTGLARVRARFADLRELVGVRAVDARLREIRGELARLEGPAAGPAAGSLEEIARGLGELDRELTRLELEVLSARSGPLASLAIAEEKPGRERGAAAQWVARKIALAAEGFGGAAVVEEGVSFGDPARARVFAVERGRHELEHDFPVEGARGAVVRVGSGTELVRRHGGTPRAYAQDVASGLRLLGEVDARGYERLLLARWRAR